MKSRTTSAVPSKFKKVEEELIRIKTRQGEIDSEIAKLEAERSELKTRQAQVLEPLIRERDRLDALVNGQKASLSFEEELFARSIDFLELTIRTANCLKADNIYSIKDLLQRDENDLLRVPNLGRRSTNEVRHVLAGRGLSIGQLKPTTK